MANKVWGKTLLFSVLFLSLFNLYVFSKTKNQKFKDMSLEELMNIKVITASRSLQKIDEAPAVMYVVTGEQIRQRGYFVLIDLLEDIPGIEIQKKSRAETSNLFTINGVFGCEKFIILQDGIRINATAGTPQFIGYSYSLENVKQVEILLGPSSALYGADAFSGVINIISKKRNGKNNGSFYSSYGSANTFDTAFGLNIGNDEISLTVNGKYYKSDEPYYPDIYTDEYRWYNDVYAKTGEMKTFNESLFLPIEEYNTPTKSYLVNIKLNLKNFVIGYYSGYDSHGSSESNGPDTYIFAKDNIYSYKLETLYFNHNYINDNNKFKLFSSVSFQNFKVPPTSRFVNIYSNFQNGYKYERSQVFSFEEKLTFNISKKYTIIGGFSYQNINAIPKSSDLPFMFNEDLPVENQYIPYIGTDVFDNEGNDLTIYQDFYQINYCNIGSYLQIQGNILKGIKLTAGMRMDYNSRYDFTFNPRIGLNIDKLENLKIKILYGQAYLAPSPYKSYRHYGSFYKLYDNNGEVIGLGSGFWSLPNPELKPEKLYSLDLDLIYFFNNNFNLHCSLFYKGLDDLIITRDYMNQSFHDIPVDIIRRGYNSGKGEVYGGTGGFNSKFSLSKNIKIDLSLHYTFTDGTLGETPLIYSSKHSIKSKLNIKFKENFNIYLSTRYRSGANDRDSTMNKIMKSEPFTIFDIYTKYKLLKNSRFELEGFVKITNLFNIKYYNTGYDELVNTPQDPIRINLGIRLISN